MGLLAFARNLFRNLRRKREVEQELDDEVRAYWQLLVEEHEARGDAPALARRKATLEIGGVEQVKEQVRVARTGAFLDSVLQDLRYALRSLRNAPVFALAAAVSIGLGVGANTGVFTLVNSVLLKPLPVANPDSLVAIFSIEKGKQNGENQLSRPNLMDLRERTRSFTFLAGTAGPTPIGLSQGAASVGVFVEFATGDYLQTLGLQPLAGRFFTTGDDRAGGGQPVAVLAHAAWVRRFGANPGAIGQVVRVNGVPVTIIGIAPAGFKGLSNFFGPELWLPSTTAGVILGQQGRAWLTERQAQAFNAVGRLRPGVSRQQAEAELRAIAGGLENEFPNANAGRSLTARPVTELSLFPGLRGGLMIGGAFLLAVVGLVLLIACSNVANLQLARASARRQEIAIRLALGAARSRIVRQLMTESLLLAAAGGALGVALAALGKRAAWSFRPAVVAGSLIEPELDATVLIYSLVISVLAGLAFGLVPALQASSPAIAGTLQEESRASGGRRKLTVANALVALQVGFASVCLVIAGVCLRTVDRLYSSNPGFETSRLAIISVSPAEEGYTVPRSMEYFQAARARLATLPGVSSVTWARNPLLFGGLSRAVEIEGAAAPRTVQQRAGSSIVNVVDLAYFSTIGLPLTRGRDFGPQDSGKGQPTAIVNEAFAAAYWPSADALGRRFRFPGESSWRTVVGIARTASLVYLGEAPQPCAYLPLAQSPQGGMILYLRTTADPAAVLGTAQKVLRELDPRISPQDGTTIRELMDNNLWIARVIVGLFAVLGLLALVLASVGLYGVMAYTVGRRRREIGVRVALGARPGRVVALIFGGGMAVVMAGIGCGTALGLLAGFALASFVPSLALSDPLSTGGALAILLTVAAIACWLPAWRASRLDPIAALREG